MITLPDWRRIQPICCVMLVGALGGCGQLFGITYGVDLVNHGENGVLILEMGSHEAYVRKPYKVTMASGEDVMTNPQVRGIEDLAFIAGAYPSIPSKYRNPADSFSRFPGYSNSLPKKVTVVWQLVELKDCTSTFRLASTPTYEPDDSDIIRRSRDSAHLKLLNEIRGQGYDPSKVVNKSNCTWHPIPNKIFRKTIDMVALQKSEAYKRTGESNPNVALSKFVLNIKFIFMDEELKVEAQSRTTNPWK